jgi:hypothetical protein
MQAPWITKAHRVIGDLCLDSYRAANRGKKCHVPYSVPDDAAELLRCVKQNDEVAAKAIFVRMAVLGE